MESIEKLLDSIRDSGDVAHCIITWITIFGVLVLLYYVVKCIIYFSSLIKLYFVDQVSNCCRIDLREKYGQWALVTGATDGIGLQFAHELARRGMSIIIVGRNSDKLAQVKASLQRETSSGEIVTIKKDFSDSSLVSYNKLRKQIDPENRDIGILINNVGVYVTNTVKFTDVNEEDLKLFVDVNVTATVMVTRAVLPSMLERQRGLVVNVSSLSGHVVSPYVSIYSATKAFVNYFSKQIQFEYRKYPNVKIVNLSTGPVTTDSLKKFTEANETRDKLFPDTPNNYVRSVLNILTKQCHPLEFTGLAKHTLLKSIHRCAEDLGLLAPIAERWLYKGGQ